MVKFLIGILGAAIFAAIAVFLMRVFNMDTGILYYIIAGVAGIIGLFTFEALYTKFKK